MQKTLSIVSISAIRSNISLVKRLVNGRFFYAVVKAEAYGHGAAEVCRNTEDLVDGFCVAIVDEGVALRLCGITKPILVLTPPLGEGDAERMQTYNLQATVSSVNGAALCKNLYCHVAVNTGMNRYGCTVEKLPDVLKAVGKSRLVGLYSHLYCPADRSAVLSQLKIFKRAEAIARAYSQDILAHLAASGGILCGEDCLFNGVRCGLLMYGYAPTGFKLEGLKPALKVYARLSHKTEFIGGGVGYNRAEEDYKRLYTYRLGYADGFSRVVPLGEKSLCMDSFISKKGGEYALVFDNADEYAARCGTISYEVLCSVTRRSRIVYER